MTAIQQVAAVSAAINGGTLYKPYIVKRLIEPETEEIIQENKPQKVRQVISEETSKEVRRALESVVALGSGRNAYIENYRVGGKTGTAQKVSNGVYMVGNYITSFIGFLPANDPKVVVYVAIDNPKGITAYGGTVAAPIAKNILEDVIQALDIPEAEDGVEKEYRYFDEKYVTVPDVVGMDTKEARKLLTGFDIEYSGSGNKIVSMSPEAGSRVVEGSVVRLMLGN